MNEKTLTKDDIASRGREIYERDIRNSVERGHEGEFLIVDVRTGYYAVGKDQDDVFYSAEEKNPQGLFYLMRVGHRAAHRIGTSSRL